MGPTYTHTGTTTFNPAHYWVSPATYYGLKEAPKMEAMEPVELEAVATDSRQVALQCAVALFCAGRIKVVQDPDSRAKPETVLAVAEQFHEWLEKK